MTLPKYQWRRDQLDQRDHLYAATASAKTKLASRIDLRKYCSSIEDQEQLGSCTGNAIAGVVELLARKQQKNIDVSRLFIYYEERVMEGTVNLDAGAYIRDGIKVVNKLGAPLEALWPYDAVKFAEQPTVGAYTDALTRRATAYQRCVNYTAVKTAVSQGYPVVIGFDVYESFETAAVARTGIMPLPNARTEQYLGGHAAAIVGYDDGFKGGRFIVRNSWGTGWGDRGYFYMPYGVIQDTTMSNDFWVITAVTV